MVKRNVPEVRFKDFTDNWEERKLMDIAKKVSTKNIDLAVSETFTNSAEYGVISQRDYFDHDVTNAENIGGYYVIGENDFVYNPRISAAAPVGPVNRNKLNKKGVMSPLYTIFKTHDIDLSFLEFYFKGNKWHNYMYFNGDTGARFDRFSIKNEVFFDMPVPYPKEEEQRKIGEYLKNLDGMMTLHKIKYEKLKLFKEAMLDKMFPKNGEKVPEIRFKGFDGEWERRELGDVVDIFSGRDYKHLSEGDIPVYGTGGYMLSVNEALSYDKDAIGIGRKGTIDKPYILHAPFWTVDTLFYVIPCESSTIDFIYDIFQTIEWGKKDESTGVPSMSKNAIFNTQIMIPSSKEQRKIGLYFKELDNLITLHQLEYEKLNLFKEAMLDKMF